MCWLWKVSCNLQGKRRGKQLGGKQLGGPRGEARSCHIFRLTMCEKTFKSFHYKFFYSLSPFFSLSFSSLFSFLFFLKGYLPPAHYDAGFSSLYSFNESFLLFEILTVLCGLNKLKRVMSTLVKQLWSIFSSKMCLSLKGKNINETMNQNLGCQSNGTKMQISRHTID